MIVGSAFTRPTRFSGMNVEFTDANLKELLAS